MTGSLNKKVIEGSVAETRELIVPRLKKALSARDFQLRPQRSGSGET